MHSPKAPEAPDPMKTAIGQTGANMGSAIGTQLTNATNQVTPQGNLTYSQDGERSWVDPLSGKTYKVPILTATQTYSPEQQHLYDLDTQTQTNIGNIGVQQSQRMGELLNSPVDLSSTAIDDNLYSRYSPRVIAAAAAGDADAHKSQLAAQGITQGSAAWDHEMDQESQHNNDQWNSLYLGGRQQAIGEMIQQRQEPINELTGLLSQSQVTNPAFGQTPTAAIKPPDYEGDVYNSYNAQMQGYNVQAAEPECHDGWPVRHHRRDRRRACRRLGPIGSAPQDRHLADRHAPQRPHPLRLPHEGRPGPAALAGRHG
jgi:hypothetical protein